MIWKAVKWANGWRVLSENEVLFNNFGYKEAHAKALASLLRGFSDQLKLGDHLDAVMLFRTHFELFCERNRDRGMRAVLVSWSASPHYLPVPHE